MAAVTYLLLFLCIVQSSFGESMHFEFPPEKIADGEENVTSEKEVEGHDGGDANANKYLDAVLKNVQPIIREKAEPLKIPDYQKNFKKKFGPINLTGNFQATDAYLSGLSSLHRAGDTTLSTTKDLTLHLNTILGLNKLSLQCKAEVSLSKLRIPFDLTISTRYVKASVDVEASLSDLKNGAQVTQFEILEIGKISVDVRRLGPLNVILKGLGFVFLNMFKSVLKTKLGPPLMNLLNQVLRKFNIANELG